MNTAKILNLYTGGLNAKTRAEKPDRLPPLPREFSRGDLGRTDPDGARSFLRDGINGAHRDESPEVVTLSEAEVFYLPISDTQAAYPSHTPYIQTTLLAQMLAQDASDQGLEITPYSATAQLYARQQPPPPTQPASLLAMDLSI